MTRYRAAWVLPIAGPPISNGWVAVVDGRVAGTGRGPGASPETIDLGDAVILPGLVNAHTHLELSVLRDRVRPAASMPEWVRALLRERHLAENTAVVDAGKAALAEAHRAGTALVADISNTLETFGTMAAGPGGGVVFHELIGFNPSDPVGLVRDALARVDRLPATVRVRVGLAAHAPYSVAPAVFRALRQAHDRRGNEPMSIHLAESSEECTFLRTGAGPWRTLLEDLGVWAPDWEVPRCGPLDYLRRLGWLDRHTLVVHGVQLMREELCGLAAADATLVTCPRSNGRTGAGVPPVDEFFASGVRLAVGTDSLASAPDLNVFAELAELRRLAPDIPARRLLESATRAGAEALGFGQSHGTIEPGRVAALIAVRVPAAVRDVEEYLLSGIAPEDISWLTDDRLPS